MKNNAETENWSRKNDKHIQKETLEIKSMKDQIRWSLRSTENWSQKLLWKDW